MHLIKGDCIALTAMMLFVLALPLRAEVIEAEGVASIKTSGIERARQLAIEDAKDQASMQAGVEVRTATMVSQGGISFETGRMRPTARIGKVTVVREWQAGDDFHVKISANLEHHLLVSQKYKKKITATPFFIQKSYLTGDLDDISTGFSRELLRRLDAGNKFIIKNSLYVLPVASNGPSQDNTAVMRLATLYTSQFVIAGEILDVGSSDEGGFFDFFQHKRRRFDVDVFVYDGLTGALIARHRMSEFADGDVFVGRDKQFGSASFFSTKYGQAINRTIDAAAELISKDLEQLPFTAKVIQITDGNIYIDAGGTSFIAPGDKLVAYRIKRELSLRGLGSGSEYGITETPVATVSIIQVQPMFSICTLPSSAKNVTMEVGDLVRFDFVEHPLN